jgi:transcriptional repressor NrdR
MARPKEVMVACPKCGNEETDILMTRDREHDVYRRRKCQACGHRFSTSERIAQLHPITMQKKELVFTKRP